jgi:membrane protease YdiL (CAAX protease family)
VRWGWVVAAFALTAVLAELVLLVGISVLGLQPHWPYALDDPRLAITSWGHLCTATLASLVAWKLGEVPGLRRPGLFFAGLCAGALLISLTVGIAALASGTLVLSSCTTRVADGFKQLVFIGPTAAGEELWLRGAGLRALARGTSPAVAVVGTGLLFGALHLFNPEASPIAAVNVALVGIWFGTLAWRAQSIWPAIGAHLAWNWFEGFFWGQNVSGIEARCSLFTATTRGAFFSGGGFGPEASGLTAVLLALACAVTLAWRPRQ